MCDWFNFWCFEKSLHTLSTPFPNRFKTLKHPTEISILYCDSIKRMCRVEVNVFNFSHFSWGCLERWERQVTNIRTSCFQSDFNNFDDWNWTRTEVENIFLFTYSVCLNVCLSKAECLYWATHVKSGGKKRSNQSS
jgi:hypothetical protein